MVYVTTLDLCTQRRGRADGQVLRLASLLSLLTSSTTSTTLPRSGHRHPRPSIDLSSALRVSYCWRHRRHSSGSCSLAVTVHACGSLALHAVQGLAATLTLSPTTTTAAVAVSVSSELCFEPDGRDSGGSNDRSYVAAPIILATTDCCHHGGADGVSGNGSGGGVSWHASLSVHLPFTNDDRASHVTLTGGGGDADGSAIPSSSSSSTTTTSLQLPLGLSLVLWEATISNSNSSSDNEHHQQPTAAAIPSGGNDGGPPMNFSAGDVYALPVTLQRALDEGAKLTNHLQAEKLPQQQRQQQPMNSYKDNLADIPRSGPKPSPVDGHARLHIDSVANPPVLPYLSTASPDNNNDDDGVQDDDEGDDHDVDDNMAIQDGEGCDYKHDIQKSRQRVRQVWDLYRVVREAYMG